jgi:hypothetical protein
MPKEREATIIHKWKPLASRPTGIPKNRWEDDLGKDLQITKIKNGKKSVLNIENNGRQMLSGPKLTYSCSVYQVEEESLLD